MMGGTPYFRDSLVTATIEIAEAINRLAKAREDSNSIILKAMEAEQAKAGMEDRL